MTASSEFAQAPLRVETITDRETVRILVQGEVDVASVDRLDAALAGIELQGTSSVLLDVSDLAFFDVAALRCLLAFAQAVKESGRDITTCGATPMLRDVARTLELHDDLGLH